MKRLFHVGILLAAVSFAFHLLCERLHIHLYTGYGALEGALPVYVYATLGDVLYTFIGVGIWVLFGGRLRRPQMSDFAFLACIGLCLALFVEMKAQMMHRWTYTDAMPLVYEFGLSPLLQMAILLPLSMFLVARIERWFNEGNG